MAGRNLRNRNITMVEDSNSDKNSDEVDEISSVDDIIINNEIRNRNNWQVRERRK